MAKKPNIYEENWKRALADYQNLVKRFESEKRLVVKMANNNLLVKLLPTLDILELAAKHSNDPGVVMAVKQFQEVLKEEGLSVIDPQPKEEFNPMFHDCVENLPGESDDQDNKIAEVLSKGYKIGDEFVIRPAKVKVWHLTK